MAKMSAYSRHWKRISQQIRRMEKRGYIFDPEFREELKAKSARSLAHIKTKYLYKHSRYLDVETGEVKSAEVRRKEERSAASRLGAETKKRRKQQGSFQQEESGYYPESDDIIMYNLNDLLAKLNAQTPTHGITREGRKAWKDGAVTDAASRGKASIAAMVEGMMADENARAALADRVQAHSQEIADLIDVIEYSRYHEEVMVSIGRLTGILSPDGFDFATAAGMEDEGWYEEYRYTTGIDPEDFDMYEE